MTLRKRMARGAAWMVLFRLLDRGLGLVSTVFLARLLLPADFGLVAMATSLIDLLRLIAYFGFDIALLRQAETTEAHFHSAWTLNVFSGAGIAAIMAMLAYPTAYFYHQSALVAVVFTLAAVPLVQGFENVGVVNFQRDMRFDREFWYLFFRRAIRFISTLLFALWFRTYWALVVGILIGRVSGVLFSYVVHPFRPRFSLAAARGLMLFSKWLMLQNFVTFLRDRSSDFVIGRIAGSSSLGIFSIAAEISNMPGTTLVAPINRAILPAYMHLANDLPALAQEYLSVMATVALVAVPAVAGVALCAPFLVLFLLGPKWTQAAPLIEVLAFSGISQVMQSNAYSAFLALGKPEVYVRITSVQVSILVALLIALTSWQSTEGAAWAYVLSSAITLPISFYVIGRHLGLRPSRYLAALWRPVVGTLFMYLGVRLFGPALPGAVALPASSAVYSLFVCFAIGAPLYLVVLITLWVFAGRPQSSPEAAALKRLSALCVRRTLSS